MQHCNSKISSKQKASKSDIGNLATTKDEKDVMARAFLLATLSSSTETRRYLLFELVM